MIKARFRYQFILIPVLLLGLGFTAGVMAQVRVLLKLDPKIKKTGQPYFFAGSINKWNPGDASFRFSGDSFTVMAAPGDWIEYKITRGSWNAVEADAFGADIPNRAFRAGTDTTILVPVVAWKDDFPPAQKKHTASANVRVLDTAFFIPQLQRYRTIRIYLPPDYERANKRYPVLYMNDGQNCFDEFTAGFGEWRVDEALDHYYDSTGKSMIVVAVDHGGEHRLQEYNPYDFDKTGKGEGKAYAEFIVETLKPHIDSLFRTKGGSKHTHIAGSSMGGVISMYIAMAYPQRIGNAGVFSPAFWTARPIYDATDKRLMDLREHAFFLYAGGNESNTMVADTKEMYRVLTGIKKIRVRMVIDEMATHNENAWSKWFPVYLKSILR